VLDATSNGAWGSRPASTTGCNAASGATGALGSANAGRSFGASAAICWTGGAVDSGATSGFSNWLGRSTGAYSGPSSQVAMQSS